MKKRNFGVLILTFVLLFSNMNIEKNVQAEEIFLNKIMTIEMDDENASFSDGILTENNEYVAVGEVYREEMYDSTAFIVSYDKSGDQKWLTSGDDYEDYYFREVVEMNENLFVVSGGKFIFEGIDEFNPLHEYYLFGFDNEGNELWKKEIKPDKDDIYISSIQKTKKNTVLMIAEQYNHQEKIRAQHIIEYDVSGSIIEEKVLDDFLITDLKEVEGKYYATGITAGDEEEAAFREYDENFNLLSESLLPVMGRDIGSFEFTDNGDIYGMGNQVAGGASAGNYIWKMTSERKVEWIKDLDGNSYYPDVNKVNKENEDGYSVLTYGISEFIMNENNEIFVITDSRRGNLLIRLNLNGEIENYLEQYDMFVIEMIERDGKLVTFGQKRTIISDDNGQYDGEVSNPVINVFSDHSTMPDVEELAGVNRYSTAVTISQKMYQKSDTAILVLGSDYPDALAAGPLAALYEAPILLARGTSIPKTTMDEITRLGVEKVVILGGEAVIGKNIEEELKANGIKELVRISGSHRYATAVEVAKKLDEVNDVNTVILASGGDFADALSAGSYASKMNYPILLTGNKNLSSTTEKALQDFEVENVIVMGGETAISSDVMKKLEEMGIKGTRIAGSNRYNTATELASGMFSTSKELLITNGEDYADALSAAPYAAKIDAPIILVPKTRLSNGVKEYFSNVSVEKITFVGGFSAVSEGNRNEIRSIMTR